MDLMQLSLVDSFNKTFIQSDRWRLFVQGLGNTLVITLFAALIGVLIGVVVAVLKVYCAQSGKLKPVNWLLDIYLTVIRGTPVLVQLMIMYYAVFASADNGVPVAILTFGINSGAYVAEIVRGGIQAVDGGQTEAGRSLGLSAWTTMRSIVLPQAVKNILPALGNEFITLVKETSVVGYIAIQDLTKAGDIVRTRTYETFFPLLMVALVYLIIVIGLTKLQRMLERRMAKSDRR